MALSNINYDPKMTQYMVSQKAFEKRKMVIVDVGARYGGEQHWDVYGDQLILIGFEPDKAECAALNEKFGSKGHRFFPIALHRDKGERPFYLTQFNASAGFYKNDMVFWSRFKDGDNLKVYETLSMETTDFDSFALENRIGNIDFMKLDVEGAELDVLLGSTNTIRKDHFLGASIEVRFQSYSKQPIFCDIDSFMRETGFSLFDLEVYRHTKTVLPETSSYKGAPSTKGQVLWADSLYLKDVVAEIEKSTTNTWDDISILKSASLFELFGLPDCAIELLQTAGKHDCLKDWDIEHLVNLLTPQFAGKDVSYQTYLQNIMIGKKPPEQSIIDIVWKDMKLVGSRCLPTPMKRFLNRLILHT